MRTVHQTFSLAGQTLHQIDFDASTLTPADLLWLPHHTQLARSVRKRQAEHLAGRIAAMHALKAFGDYSVPAPGAQRQPLWPAGLYGSISHSAQRALAVVSRQPVGIDIEVILSSAQSAELADSIVSANECTVLRGGDIPFEQALTLAFSAKESLYKAFSHLALPFPGFNSAEIVAMDRQRLTLRLLAEFSPQLASQLATVFWQTDGRQVVTLIHGFPC